MPVSHAGQPQIRPPRLRTRGSLIAATVLLQGLIIGLGVLATLHAARSGLETRVHEQTLDAGAKLAAEFNEVLESEFDSPIKLDTLAWTRAQDMICRAQPADGGTLLLLDPYGQVLCHPELDRHSGLSRLDYSEQPVILHPDDSRMELGQLRPNGVLTGTIDTINGSATVALCYNPTAQAKVLVVQPRTPFAAQARRLGDDMLWWFGLGGAGVLVLTILGSALVVRVYDSALMRANRQLESELERRVRRGMAIRNGLIFGLAKLADFRDTDTGRHLERICRYSEILAEALRPQFAEITRPWIERLKLASSMHDIGKVGIADAILLKPGALTPEERRVMEKHTVFGADTLIAIRRHVGDDDLLNMGIQVALSHHERYDGTGYPYKLSGDQIPLAARIVALADMYDALTSRRVYKAAMTHEQAVRIILEGRGTHFDPRIADAFERVRDSFDQARALHHPPEGDEDRPLLVEAVRAAAQARGLAA